MVVVLLRRTLHVRSKKCAALLSVVNLSHCESDGLCTYALQVEVISGDAEGQIVARKMTRHSSPSEGVAGVGWGGREPRIYDTYLFPDAAETFILAADMK